MPRTSPARLLFASTIAVALSACGGGGSTGDGTPAQPESSVAAVDYERLATSIKVIQATYVGGMAGGVGTLTTGARVGDTLPCPAGGTVSITSATGSTVNAQYPLRNCVLGPLPAVTFNGVVPGTGDLGSFGGLEAAGAALGLPARYTFSRGGLQGTPAERSPSSYGVDNDLTGASEFIAGSATRYAVERAHVNGVQIGTAANAELRIALAYGAFEVRGRRLDYQSTAALVWAGNGRISAGELVVTEPQADPSGLYRRYVFGDGGAVRVLDATNGLIGSFSWGGPSFQEALAATGQ